jgi:phage N-6-adenine-methyltransferase
MHCTPKTKGCDKLSEIALQEATRLAQLEDTIQRGLNTFVDVGNALLEIRDSRLYRESHSTFEDYCRDRWGMSRPRAYQMIEAAEVVGNLSTNVDILPATESVARPLTSLPPETQRTVWAEAVTTAPNGKVTAAHVASVAQEYMGAAREPRSTPHVSHNSGNNEWYTPAEYIEAARRVMGGIDLDPASSAIANEVVNAGNFYTAEDNGLQYPWFGCVWMNPPYSSDLVSEFADKMAWEYQQGNVTEAIVLINNATETRWFRTLIDVASAVVFPSSRVKFWKPDGDLGAPLQGQSIIYLGKSPSVFLSEFNGFGWGATL